MLTLASMTWAAFMYVVSSMGMMHHPPVMPVVIEVGNHYEYSEIDSAITVPANWADSCYNQKQLIYYMAKHINNYRNGNRKFKPAKLLEIKDKWVCLDDTNGEK